MSEALDPRPGITLHTAKSFSEARLPAPDVYFGPDYGRAEQANGAGEWVSFVCYEGGWQMPLHLRASSVGTDAVSPYGYAGVYASESLSAHDRSHAWALAQESLRDRQVLSVFLRQSPLVNDPFEEPPGERVVSGHSTVRVETCCEADAWSAMEGRCRTSIRKADREGCESTVRPAALEDVQAGGDFRRLYEGAMRRRGAASRYYFGDGYYRALCEGLGDGLLVGTTRDSGGRCVAAALFMRHGNALHYHLSGSEVEAGRMGATNQLIWRAIEWAATRDVSSIHLGGGVANGDSLFKFKRSFGGQVLQFNAYGVVIDHQAYDAAVEARAAELNRSAKVLLDCGHFPAFRASI